MRLVRAVLGAARIALAWSTSVLAQPVITEFPLPGSGPVNSLGWANSGYAKAMTAGPDGALWLTHSHESLVVRMAVDGALTEYSVAPAVLPSGIAVGSDRNIWFLLNGSPHGIARMSTSGQFVTFPVSTTSWLCGLVSAPDGNLWFTESTVTWEAKGPEPTAAGRVAPGGAITTYPLPSGRSGTGIIVSAEGNLWFSFSDFTMWGSYGHGIQRMSLQGTRGSVVDSLGPGDPLANSLALGPDGNGWFTASDNTVGKVTSAGVVTKFPIPTAAARPIDITAGPDGNLWFTEYAGNKIGRITPQGVITEFPVPTPNAGPVAICVGPDGNIWFTESEANKVGRLVLSGPASGKATLTIPTAASKAGHDGTSFHTDIWLLNRSYF
jgi:streptogramin lyase